METVYIKFIQGTRIWHLTTQNTCDLEECLLKIISKMFSNSDAPVNTLITNPHVKIDLTTQYNNEDLAYCILAEYCTLGVIEKSSLHLQFPIINKIIHS
jgi:hypothetical protein